MNEENFIDSKHCVYSCFLSRGLQFYMLSCCGEADGIIICCISVGFNYVM